MWWLGWIYLMTDFKEYTAIYCPTFVNIDTTSYPEYPFHCPNSQVMWHAFMGLNPTKNSNYNCINSPRIIECQSLGEGKYCLNKTCCYEFANITQSPFWSSIWIPNDNNSAGYRTAVNATFEGPVQFTTGTQYANVFSKFTIQEFRWERTAADWSNVDIAYNKIDLQNEVFLPEYANSYEKTIDLTATGSYLHKQVYNDYPIPDETYAKKWRDGGYFYAKRFDNFILANHTYQKKDPSSRLYEGLRICNNPNQIGVLEVNFILEKIKGTKCKIRFKYGPFTNTSKTGNITIKTLDGTAVNANEIEVSSYGTSHKLTLQLDKSHGTYSDLYVILIPYDGSSEYVTADAETIEYVQGIKFTGDSFNFIRDN